MKPLHLPLFVVGMLAPFLLTAQSLHLIGSSPANHSANVALATTVTFTFNQALQPGTIALDSIGDRFIVIPYDRISIQGMEVAPDSRSVTFTVTHQPDVDYTWLFFGLRAATGEEMTDFNIVSYTTSSVSSAFSVEGQLILQDAPPTPHYSSSIVMLLTDLSFMNVEGSDGPQEAMKYAGVPNVITGEYSMPGVKPGNYYVLAMMFSTLSDEMEPSRIGMHTNALGDPQMIQVTDASITGLDLIMKQPDFGPGDLVDATQAFAVATSAAMTVNPHARPIYLEARNHHMPPAGDSDEWFSVFYSDADSTVQMIRSNGERVLDHQTMHFMDIPEDERFDTDIATIKSIPNMFLPSRDAIQVAMQNGLSELLAPAMTDNDVFVEVVYMLSHFYFEYDQFVSATSNPFWTIEALIGNQFGFTSAYFLIDAVTGSFIGKEIKEELWGPVPMELMHSIPSHMTSSVPLQTTVSFSFNEPIQIETLNGDSRMQTWSVFPMDLTIHDITYSEDFRTVYMDVVHAAETDYVWTFQSVRSTNGGGLQTAAVVNYTTQATVSPLMLAGSLIWPEGDFFPQPNHAMAVVVLLDSPDYFTNGMNGPPPDVRNAGANLMGTWDYSMANVRPGTYYPAVFVFTNGFEYGQLLAYGYSPDANDNPKSVTISDQSFTQYNIPLRFVSTGPDHQRTDVLEVLDDVRQHVAAQETGAELITLFGREELMRPAMPTGTSYEWSFIYFESATDTVQMIEANSDGITMVDRFHLSTVPEEERIPEELVRPLPSTFIGSSQAMSTALSNGLDVLINTTPNEAWAQVRYSLSNFYFQHPDILDEDSPPFWDIQYNAEIWNMDQMTWQREANFLIDALTGNFIFKTETTGIEPDEQVRKVELDQNYPNPFNPKTEIRYRKSEIGKTRLTVYDILGREVAVLVDGVMPVGHHRVTFDASALPSGIYLYRLEAGGEIIQRKMTVVK